MHFMAIQNLKYFFAVVAAGVALAASVEARGGSLPVEWSGLSRSAISVEAPSSTGLDAVVVIDGLSGVTATFTASSASSTVAWQSYDSRGGGYAETITSGISRDGAQWTLSTLSPDTGYIIQEVTSEGSVKTYYFWLVDYSLHRYSATSLEPDTEDSGCSETALLFDGSADAIIYYSITGRAVTLDRELELSYTNQVEGENAWSTEQITKSLESASTYIYLDPVYCSTSFTLEGDRFLREWGQAVSVTSSTLQPTAVSAIIEILQLDADTGETTAPDGTELGGSAPVDVTMNAYLTDAAINPESQISDDYDFTDYNIRINEAQTAFTFRTAGTTYLRFVTANAEGSCEWMSDTYIISIGESYLRCPNAFSPADQNGVNDEWKVSYQSIVEFECHIFNRWGVKLYSFTDPALGWDGKYKGKYVGPGVYYYVIKARGADDRAYNLSGDINIIGYK